MLARFSIDLIKLICAYLAYRTAGRGEQPLLLQAFAATQVASDSEIWRPWSMHCILGVGCSFLHEIWLCTAGRVQLFDMDCKFMRFAQQPTTHNLAAGIAFAKNGDAYVVIGHGIHVFRKDGSFAQEIGSQYTADPKHPGDVRFQNPCFVAIDNTKNQLYVTDSRDRVQVLNLDGIVLETFRCDFNDPRGIAVSPSGAIAVGDCYNHCVKVCASKIFFFWRFVVQVLDSTGNLLTTFGGQGTAEGRLNSPDGLAVDSAANWLVCDNYNNRIQVFSADGNFITAIANETLYNPKCVAVDTDGRVLVGSSHARVHVFGFAHEA